MIEINKELKLKTFNKETDGWIVDEINGASKSNMIHHIEERLLKKNDNDDLSLNQAYLVVYDNNIIGYIYLSGKTKNYYYIEYLIFKKFRNQGLGSFMLNNVCDYVFENMEDIEECRLSIDKSNIASINVACANGFILDEDSVFYDKLEFIKDNDRTMYFKL